MADEPKELPDGTTVDTVQPKDAAPWLNLLQNSERVFRDWNERCDNIDKLFANLSRLATLGRERQMQLFWANLQVLGPAIYARTPVPVIMPRFKVRKPIPRTASELLERSTIVSFETSKVDRTLKMVRNDLIRLGRGVSWCRFETGKGGAYGKKVCTDFKFRRDFLHDPARCWAEVDWVAGAAYMTRGEMRKRFLKTSGNAYKDAEYEVRKDSNDTKTDLRNKAKVWELWSKSQNKVVWVAEGGDKVLDEDEAHLSLDEFFPCPEPAYGTLQPESLIPVPDVLQYKDQLEEINELTGRIAALTDAIKVRGFIPAGNGELGDVIEAAIKASANNVILVPVANWAIMGDKNPSDMVLWWPIEMVANTIQVLIGLRRQLIQDVYEISGISDILRGQTDPTETLGAQELKAQTGSARVRAKQEEMVRVSKDLTCITAEIMAEDFDSATLLSMSQMELPTKADVDKQIKALEQQGKKLKAAVEAAMAEPDVQQQAQQNPEEAKAAMAEADQKAQGLLTQIEELRSAVTIDDVMKFLRDEKVRPYVLDIETDSTIVADENAKMELATKYVASMSGLLQQLVPAVQQVPQMAPLASEIIRHVNGVFRVGRQFEQVVEEFTDQIKEMAGQPKPPDPAVAKAQADEQERQARLGIDQQREAAATARAQADAQRQQVENAERMAEIERKRLEAQDASAKRQADIAAGAALAELQRTIQREEHEHNMRESDANLRLINARIDQVDAGTLKTAVSTVPPAAPQPIAGA